MRSAYTRGAQPRARPVSPLLPATKGSRLLGPEYFTVIVVALLALLGGWLAMLGLTSRRRQSTASERAPGRRDVIAEGVIDEPDLDEMLQAENERLREQERSRGELAARVVGDEKYRWRLLRRRRRRRA